MVILDILWNLSFAVVLVVILSSTLDERPMTPLRIWIASYTLQCILHMIYVAYEYINNICLQLAAWGFWEHFQCRWEGQFPRRWGTSRGRDRPLGDERMQQYSKATGICEHNVFIAGETIKISNSNQSGECRQSSRTQHKHQKTIDRSWNNYRE